MKTAKNFWNPNFGLFLKNLLPTKITDHTVCISFLPTYWVMMASLNTCRWSYHWDSLWLSECQSHVLRGDASSCSTLSECQLLMLVVLVNCFSSSMICLVEYIPILSSQELTNIITFFGLLIGTSLSEPHTSVTVLVEVVCMYVCMYVCMFAAIYRKF